jgi:hypothetical protein
MFFTSLGRYAEADNQPRSEKCAQDEEYDSQSAMVYCSHWLSFPFI